MPSPIWNMRLDPTQRVEWEQAAAKAGVSLAEFVRGSVEQRLVGSAKLPEPRLPRVAVTKGFGATSSKREARPFSKAEQTGKS
jgi:hypothetical protein